LDEIDRGIALAYSVMHNPQLFYKTRFDVIELLPNLVPMRAFQFAYDITKVDCIIQMCVFSDDFEQKSGKHITTREYCNN